MCAEYTCTNPTKKNSEEIKETGNWKSAVPNSWQAKIDKDRQRRKLYFYSGPVAINFPQLSQQVNTRPQDCMSIDL